MIEAINVISQLSGDLPARLAQVTERASALHDGATALTDQSAAARALAATQIEAVTQPLKTLEDFAAAAQEELDSAADEVTGRIVEVQAWMDTAQSELAGTTQVLTEKLHGFEEAVAEHKTMLLESSEKVVDTLGALDERLRADRARFEGATATFFDRVNLLQQQVDSVKGELGVQVGHLAAAIEDCAHRTGSSILEMGQSLLTHDQESQQKVGDVLGLVQAHSGKLEDHLREEVESFLAGEVNRIVGVLAKTLDDLMDRFIDSPDEMMSIRQLIEPALDLIGGYVDPMHEACNHVHEVAERKANAVPEA
ncbi:MAG: hypothetical protein AUK47_24715 [Deltaproteobacteria bacterium CG2_30_63_29]|nr:MAG: hypothetical protein AUK47_24715 [Deltaproteobacteria bacterium CG2_30_63_29]PJB45756.1 MAG: hypothetical protein CO108_06745 [Deltaproteobacteria bacterium CG_4_9_14_3_um_filter_63_12]